ncbi:hypothetical protein [Nitrosospira briensis]|nr:hypothetical protein [Nitrosospira briensis]
MKDLNCPLAGRRSTQPYDVTMATTMAASYPHGRQDKRQEMEIA